MSSCNLLADKIHAEDVATYLNKNREFFHVFPNLLGELSVPHPKTGKEISLLERQVYQLRNQRDTLKIEVDALKDAAGSNGVLLHKVYQLANALLAADTSQDAIDVVMNVMNDTFEIEQVSLVSWDVPNQSVSGIQQLGLSQGWATTLRTTLNVGKPMCGLLENDWQKGLFQTDQLMASVCLIPLGTDKMWGVLALGATNERFSADLGTYFLEKMGDMISKRLNRLFV